MAINTSTNSILELPQADYGREVKAFEAVLEHTRTLITHMESILLSLKVHSHRIPDRTLEPIVTLQDGDIVTKIPERLVKGFMGICRPEKEIVDVRSSTDEQGSTDTGSD